VTIMSKRLTALTMALMGFGVCACATAQNVPVGTCEPMVGQAEIDGVVQQVSGTACLQPDGTWQMVDTDGTPVTYVGPPYYVDDTWYWAPPVFVGGFVFIDRFHHHHHMHNAFFHHDGRGFVRGSGFRGGFHGGHDGGHDGGHGGMHGGGMHH
jgi:surface antigen